MKIMCFLLALLITGCAEAHPKDYALRLEFERGTCSGTAVGRSIVLTAEHCWMGGRLLRINGQDAYAMKIVKDGKDHALVRVTMQFDKWATLGAAPEQAQRVSWIGQPAGIQFAYREAYVSVVAVDGACWLIAHVFGGDSGAGVFNESGRLVGMVSHYKMWRDRNGNVLIFVVAPPLDLRGLIRDIGSDRA